MKIRGFLNRLRKLSGRAKQRMRGWLRNCNGDYCPITLIVKLETNKEFSPANFFDAAREINLDYKVANNIVAAADCENNTEDLNRTQKRYHKLLTEAIK